MDEGRSVESSKIRPIIRTVVAVLLVPVLYVSVFHDRC